MSDVQSCRCILQAHCHDSPRCALRRGATINQGGGICPCEPPQPAPCAAFDAVVAERDAERELHAQQLAACNCAALGYVSDGIVPEYRSPAYEDTLALRGRFEAAEARIRALEEAGDALAAAALGADRQVAAWRAVRNREEA